MNAYTFGADEHGNFRLIVPLPEGSGELFIDCAGSHNHARILPAPARAAIEQRRKEMFEVIIEDDLVQLMLTSARSLASAKPGMKLLHERLRASLPRS